MPLSDPLGVLGAPAETLRALTDHFGDQDLTGAILVLVTDTQGKRDHARYAAVVHTKSETALTVDAFGPRFGEEGEGALRSLAGWARAAGIENVKETVISSYDFGRWLREPEEAEVNKLMAAANPSNLDIYLSNPGADNLGKVAG